MTFNIQNASIINVEGNRNHKNCKAVYCITTGEVFASVADAAEKNGVSTASMSWAVCGKSKSCRGKRFCFVSNIIEHLDEIATNNRDREAKVTAYNAMIEKQEKIRKAQAEVDKHDARIAELQEALVSEIALRDEAQNKLDALQ